MSNRKSKTVATGKDKPGCASVNGSVQWVEQIKHHGSWEDNDFHKSRRAAANEIRALSFNGHQYRLVKRTTYEEVIALNDKAHAPATKNL